MINALVASMAATLIEAARAGESLAAPVAILRDARFGAGAIRAFGGAALAMALAAMLTPAHAAEITLSGAIFVGFCTTGVGICIGAILAAHCVRRRYKRHDAERREATYKLEDRAHRAESLHLSGLQALGRAVFGAFLDAGGNLESWHCAIEREAGVHGLKYRDHGRLFDGFKRTSRVGNPAARG